jgi:VCBS repeat-containing protein
MIARPLPTSRSLRALAPVVFLATLLCIVAAPASAQTCFVEATGDNTTDYSGNGSDALQAAVNAASSGSTLKIAGTCTGVQTVAGHTQIVSVGKALTLVGGYAAGNWSAAPDPVANPTVLDAGGAGRVAFVTPSGDLTLQNLVLQNGSSSFGGAIWHEGPLLLENCLVQSNSAVAGGAIWVQGGSLTVRRSSFVGNTATTNSGGAINNSGLPMVIEHSTFSGNSAAVEGGAVTGADAPMSIRFSTFSDNSASSGGGLAATADFTLYATIIANSTGGGDCAEIGAGPVDGGYNLIEDGSCLGAPTSLSGDPALDVLAANGGVGPTHALQQTSPARDAIPINVNGCGVDGANDQRGVLRGQDAGCDLGAIETYAPVATDDAYTVVEDGMVSGNVVTDDTGSGVDSDIDSSPLTVSLGSNVSHGTLSLASNGSFAYTPEPDFNGTDSFAYVLSDGDLTDTATVTLTVTPVNDPPVATDDAYTVVEDVTLSGNVVTDDTGNGVDSDIDSSPLTASLGSNVSHGTLSLASNGSFTYTPDPDFNGTDSFNYVLSDGDLTDTATVTLTITPVNDPPVATDDAYTVDEDGALSGNVVTDDTGNGADSDIDSSPLTVSLGSNVSHGTLSLASNGSFTYTPDPDFNGTDSFNYILSDGDLTDTATVTLTVTSVNDPPVATDNAYTVVEDGTLSGNVVTDDTGNGVDSDVDSSPLTVSLGSNVSHGTLSLASNGSFTYTPNPDFNGTDSFNYILSDGDLTDTATVTLTVTPVNDPPVATDNAYTLVEDGTLSGNVVTDDTGNGVDGDVDSSPLTVSLGSNVSHGTLSLASNGSFTYTPNPAYTGTDSFTYVLSDGQLTDSAQVTLLVAPAPLELIGSDPAHQALNVDTSQSIILSFDGDIDPTTVSPQTLGLHRSVSGTAWNFAHNSGSLTLTPAAPFFAGEVVRVSISDGLRSSAGGPAVPQQIQFTAATTAPQACAPRFNDIGAGLTGVQGGDVAWGDADGDGDLDILVTGSTGGNNRITQLYLNDGGTFANVGAGLPGSEHGAVAWGDYDNDGDLDFLLARRTNARIYRNDGGTFTNISAGLPEFQESDAAWGDYDNDGDLDLVIAGAALVETAPFETRLEGRTRLYRNDGGAFTQAPVSLAGAYGGSVEWGDYDNDGDLDLLLTGKERQNTSTRVGAVYRNNGGSFTRRNVFQALEEGDARWGDYDGDGDLDIVLVGLSSQGPKGLVYRNDGGNFVQVDIGLIPVSGSAVAWGDADGDGDLDILAAGSTSSLRRSRVYINDNGSFRQTQAGLPDVADAAVAWGDYDGDGDLDILLSGWTGSTRITRVYRNDPVCALTDDSYAAVQDLTFRVDAAAGVTSNDQSGPYTVALDTPPAHGTVDLAADGGFDYTPAPGFTGADSFRYTLAGWPEVPAATVAIDVRPLTELAQDDAYAAVEDTPLTVAAPGVSANDAAYPVTLTVDVSPTHGTLTLAADGGFVYTPAPNFNGVDGFAYRATLVDDPGVTDTAVVTLTVTPVNDAPVAVDDAYVVVQDTALVVDAPGVLANDSDGDEGTQTLTASLDSGPLHGTLALDPDGSFVYTPDAGYQGVDSFTYVLSDGELTDTAMVTLTVEALHTLNVVLTGNGSGTVTSDPAGIDCGTDCSEAFPEGTVVTLTATPDPGSAVGSGWLCAGDSCTVTITGDLTVSGDFGLTGVDTHVVDGVACTLGDAIEAANRDTTVGGCIDERIGSDEIELAVDAVLTAADSARSTEIGGAYAGLPDVTSAIVIRAGTAGSRIERDLSFVCDVADPIDEFRLLQVTDGGALTLEGLILANGCADQGGAVLVDGNGVLAIVDSTFVGNSARSDGFIAQGGALWAAATATTSIDGALFQSNVASGPRAEGGALWDGGALGTLSASRFADNEVRSTELWAEGGAAYVDGDPTITGVIFERNLARAADRSGASGGNSNGGALYLYGDGATISDSLFSQNVARGGDGDVRGGIVQGGALSTDDRGAGTSLVRVTFAGNRAEGGGGGAAGGGDANGGAVFAYGVTQIDTVTFSGNTAHGGDSVDGSGGIGAGGALFVDTVDLPLAIEHTTFAANEALAGSGAGGDGSAEGGGISANDGVTVFGSLFEGNIATVGGTSTSSACFDPGFSGPLPYLTSLGFNVLSGQVGACAFDAGTDVLDAGPSLLPLGEYGCSTALPDGSCLPTHPVVIGSPAHEAGSCSASGVTADARGYSRPWDDPDIANLDDGCDAGAYESRDLDNDGFDDDSAAIFANGFE